MALGFKATTEAAQIARLLTTTVSKVMSTLILGELVVIYIKTTQHHHITTDQHITERQHITMDTDTTIIATATGGK